MARSRNIKPGFFTNDVLGELPALTRLLFAGIWTLCDREGRLEDRPKKIKAEVLPYDNCDPEAMLQDLEQHGFIHRYTAGGFKAIQVVAWDKHQNPHVKEAPSIIPAPDMHGASTVQAPDEQSPEPERAGLIPSPLIPDSLDEPPRKRAASPAIEGIPEDLLADYMVVRTAKKAGKLTETAVAGLRREADKAGISLEAAIRACCEYGWQGFNAVWYADRQAKTAGNTTFAQQAADIARTTVPAPIGRDPALMQIDADRAKAKPMPPEIRQALAQAVGRMTQ